MVCFVVSGANILEMHTQDDDSNDDNDSEDDYDSNDDIKSIRNICLCPHSRGRLRHTEVLT